MKYYWVKLTNCTTTTGGGTIPIRNRKNQNIRLVLGEDTINKIGKERFLFVRWGREYWTTYESKVNVIREI